MTRTRKTFLTILLSVFMSLAVWLGAAFVVPNKMESTTAQAASYTTKDVAMMGRVAGWYGNGNFEIRFTLGEADWSGSSVQKSYVKASDSTASSLTALLREMDFFNHIKLGNKTLAEWGCTACYDNIYWLNSGEPDYTITIPLSMGSANMAEASAAGIGADSPFTVLRGALIPSDAYLQGNSSATVYRAGCDYETITSGVAYGIKSIAKTDVVSVKYVQGHDGTCGYVGVSLKGDDYLADGTQAVYNRGFYQSSEFMTNHYTNAVLVNGVAGKAGEYGLFNLGSKGKGYYSFAFYATAEETESITIPAGTRFPSRAMNTLRDVNNNPVYIFYETQTDVTFYKQPDGSFAKPYVEYETSISSAKVEGKAEDNFTVLSFSNHDYDTKLDNYGGAEVSVKDALARSNFYSHVLIDDVALGSTNEAYINVWGNKGAIGFRTSKGVEATKITILAGCQIPSYEEVLTGDSIRYVTTEDITFIKNANGEWEVYIPAGDFNTKVTQVQFGRSNNVVNFNLSVNDYPAPDGNNAATYNIGVDPQKILSLNLLDSIIVDGYTLRTRYNKYGDDLSNPWLWINRFVGHNFAIRVANEDNAKLTPNKITIRAGAQFPSKAYIDNGTELFYVTTEEVTYVRISDDVEKSWEKQAKITFKADGKTIAELPYTKTKGIEGNVPEIPAKDGYRATWESYTLTGEDIVVNAKYTKKAYTPLPTSVSMVKVQHGDQNKATDNFLVMSLSAHDYPSDGDNLGTGNTTISSAAFLAKSNLLESILINDKPIAQSEGYANVWGNRGAFGYRTSMPDADVLKVTILAGCEFPSYATLMGEATTAYVTVSDVTFVYENGVWVRESNGEDEGVASIKPSYDNEYVLSDLHHTGHEESAELEKGYIYVDNTTNDATINNFPGFIYGYNTSHSFSLTFDFSLNLGSKDISAQGNYATFNVVMATRGYSNTHAFGWRIYLYRPNHDNKCVELYCAPSAYNGNIQAFEFDTTRFQKGQTYRITLGYKLIDEATGTVEAYFNVDGYEVKQTYVLGADEYMKYVPYIDSISFSSTTAIASGVRISDPGLAAGDELKTITLKDGDKVLAQEKTLQYTLPALDVYEYGQAGNVFIGWTTDLENLNNLYPAGYTVEVTENVTYYPVWLYLNMQDGAAVRKVNESGLRFLVDVSGAGYQIGIEKNLIVGAGTLIVPTSYLDGGLEFVHKNFPEGYYVDIATETWSKQTGDVWTYVAALINISPAQYTRSMSARGYLKIAYTNGTEAYVYTSYSKDLNARSIYQVATSAYNDGDTAAAVANYVNNVADITIHGDFSVSKNVNSVGDYTVTAEKSEKTYTITLSKAVKSLVINGQRIVAGYTTEIVIGGITYEISNFKLNTSGVTITFAVENGDSTAYYQSIVNYYQNSNDYTEIHKQQINAILAEWGGDYSNGENNAKYAAQLEAIKTQKEHYGDVGVQALATPVLRKASVSEVIGYEVVWEAVANADYYYITDDNDYRGGVYVLATERLAYKPEVVGKHNVTITAYSYYDTYNASATSASFATLEVKPVYSYKAMAEGLYKFSEDQMKMLGIGDNLNTENDGTSFRYDKDADKYFAYYNKDTGWSKNESEATDWTSPTEFPAHAARLKAMGNNILLISENTSASLKSDSIWETSRTKYVMDTAWTLGMKVIVCDDVLYKQSKEVSKKSATTVVNGRLEMIKKYVSHPAFYGFSLEDEPEPNSLFTGSELESVGYMVQALKTACANLGYSKANGNEPFFLACLYQYSSGFEIASSVVNYQDYLEDWLSGTGLDYLYVDLYTGHAMGDNTNRYEMTYDVLYGSGTNGLVSGDVKFHQVLTAHTQNKEKAGELTEKDIYMSMMYAAAHNVAGYSWFCYFPIVEETAASMVGFDGNGYGNGIDPNHKASGSYYDAASKAGKQFEFIQGLLDGYTLKTRAYDSSKCLLTTTLSNGTNTITIYVNADTMAVSKNITVTPKGSTCYRIGYGLDEGVYYSTVTSGKMSTLSAGQAFICIN